MTDKIKHRGIVEKIYGSHLQVRIIQTSACSACSIKGHCHASESKEKLIDVFEINPTAYVEGQEIVVVGTTYMGMQAVFYAFGIPFLVVMITLFLTMHFLDNELSAALIALLSLVPVYILIYMFRHKLRKKFSFSIETINN